MACSLALCASASNSVSDIFVECVCAVNVGGVVDREGMLLVVAL